MEEVKEGQQRILTVKENVRDDWYMIDYKFALPKSSLEKMPVYNGLDYDRGYMDGNAASDDTWKDGYTEGYGEGLKVAWVVAMEFIHDNIYSPLKQEEIIEKYGLDVKWGGNIHEALAEKNPQDVIDSIKIYKEKKIKRVGDEIADRNGKKAVIIEICGSCIIALHEDGRVKQSETAHEFWKKTGRNFPEIEKVLDALEGANRHDA